MIRVAIVGCNFGLAVQLPALRLDPRCEVVALAGRDAARTAELAKKFDIPYAFADWREMLEKASPDALVIAVPPDQQPAIAIDALKRGKAVFAEKPMAADLASAAEMARAAGKFPTAMDFNFIEIPAWREAKALINAGEIGPLRSIAVNWSVENQATRMRLKHWKTNASRGGGALGNFVSHSVHYLEWLGGPILGLSARIGGLPDAPDVETNVAASFTFKSGASANLTMSCAAFLGSGHRVEIYGESGTLVIANPGPDYMRGFSLLRGTRADKALALVAVDSDPMDTNTDGRVAPTARLMRRLFDGIEHGAPVSPDFASGYRAQVLLDAIRRSHENGRWLEIPERSSI